jgi:hypothetical protein
MAIKLTKKNLERLRSLFEEIGFRVRFEKGNFQSGYCLIKEHNVAVINKFLPIEGRVQAMLDIMPQVEGVDTDKLSDEGEALYHEVMKIEAE